MKGEINVVYPCSGILFGSKKRWSIDICYKDKPWKHYVKWKKSGNFLEVQWLELHPSTQITGELRFCKLCSTANKKKNEASHKKWHIVLFHLYEMSKVGNSVVVESRLAFPGGSVAKNLLVMQETQVQSLGWEDPLEKGMATHSSTLAWSIPWTEEPGRVQSIGSQRVGHSWSD